MEQQRGLANMTTLLYNVMQLLLASVHCQCRVCYCDSSVCCGKDMFHMWLRRVRCEVRRTASPSVVVETRMHAQTPTQRAKGSTSLWLKSLSSLACSSLTSYMTCIMWSSRDNEGKKGRSKCSVSPQAHTIEHSVTLWLILDCIYLDKKNISMLTF